MPVGIYGLIDFHVCDADTDLGRGEGGGTRFRNGATAEPTPSWSEARTIRDDPVGRLYRDGKVRMVRSGWHGPRVGEWGSVTAEATHHAHRNKSQLKGTTRRIRCDISQPGRPVERPNVGSSRLMTQVEVAELVAQDSAASIYFTVIALNVRRIHSTRFALLTLHFLTFHAREALSVPEDPVILDVRTQWALFLLLFFNFFFLFGVWSLESHRTQ